MNKEYMKSRKRTWGDPLDEIERRQGEELPSKMHDVAEPPTRARKRARSKKEAYRPLHRR